MSEYSILIISLLALIILPTITIAGTLYLAGDSGILIDSDATPFSDFYDNNTTIINVVTLGLASVIKYLFAWIIDPVIVYALNFSIALTYLNTPVWAGFGLIAIFIGLPLLVLFTKLPYVGSG